MTDNHIKYFMTIGEKWWLLARQWMWKIPQASPTRFEASDLPSIRQAPYPLTQLRRDRPQRPGGGHGQSVLGKEGQRNFSSTGGRAPGAFFYQTMKFYTRVPKEVAVGLRLAFHCCRMSNQSAADLSFRSLDLPALTWDQAQFERFSYILSNGYRWNWAWYKLLQVCAHYGQILAVTLIGC